MTIGERDAEESAGVPARLCAICEHSEDDHEEREAELPGTTERHGYCILCEEWHDFEPGND